MTDSPLSPERIMQLSTGGWACGILGAAITHGLFDHLEAGATASEVAVKSGISARGTQALLDGVFGLGLLRLENGRYRNTPETSAYLVHGKPGFLGGFAQMNCASMGQWSNLTSVVKTGVPVETADIAENPMWESLVTSIAGLSVPVARIAAERLGLAKAGPVTWLDVGGGSGVFSAIWLGINAQARGFQLDWANVNRIARDFVAGHGVAARFTTLDGDLHTTDFGAAKYDFALYSHIAHQESPPENVAIFRKFRKALKPGGTLVVNDFVLNDDRTGHPFAQMFHSTMVLNTKAGAAWRQADYRAWLADAGFKSVAIEPTPTPSTLIYAK